MDKEGQEIMYQSNYSSAGSRMGSVHSQQKSPADQSPTNGKGALKDKLANVE